MRAAQREPRRERRAAFDQITRLALLEDDADYQEAQMEAFKVEIRSEIRSMKNMMLGVIVTAASASIVGAINLVYQRLGGG